MTALPLVRSFPPLALAGLLVACGEARDGLLAPPASLAVIPPPGQILFVHPPNSILALGQTQTFSAFQGPFDPSTGAPDVGSDGVPGTADDVFKAIAVLWDDPDGLGTGTISPTTGSSTVFTAVQTGNARVRATDVFGRQAEAGVRVLGADELVFLDSDGVPTDLIPVFVPDLPTQNRIHASQVRIDRVKVLLDNSMVAGPGRAALEQQLNQAVMELVALVPLNLLRTVAALDLGTGTVPAALTSFTPSGGVIANYPIPLDPDGAGLLRSLRIVALLRGGGLFDGTYGDILFVAAEPDGSLVAEAPGFIAELARFISIPTS